MNSPINKKTFAKTLGILMPVFLFISSVSFVAAAPEVNSRINISFQTEFVPVSYLQQKYSLVNVEKLFDSPDATLNNFYTAEINSDRLTAMTADPFVAAVNIDSSVSTADLLTSPLITPNDTYYTSDPKFEDKQWYLPAIRLPEAWKFGKGSGNTIVAIIDTGIHASHKELNDGRIVPGYDAINQQAIQAKADSDDNGHGTAVAGIIGAISDNNAGIAGINWSVSMMPVKALKADGTGEVSAVARGIVWATDHGANIINMSLGGPGYGADQALNEAVRYAYHHNVVIVSAAGNDLADNGANLDTNPIYPVCADNGENMIIGVAASDVNDVKANFSNFGINCVDLTAPGKRILTTAFFPSDPSNNVLLYGSGTSVAAPIVSGVAALMKSNNSTLTNTQIRDILLGTADNIDNFNPNNCLKTSCAGFLGKGKLNALAALSPNPLLDGTFVRQANTNNIYLLNGGKKRFVPQFVFDQRKYDAGKVLPELNNQLASINTGDTIPPLDGTLVKEKTNSTVYFIDQGFKRPLTYPVFVSRAFSFANVKVLNDGDLSAVKTGEWYYPPDGTMVLITTDPTVYVMSEGVRRPVTYFVFTQRKLSFAKVLKVTQDEFFHIPAPTDSFWLPPLDGTLVKSKTDSTVYLIENKVKRTLSGPAFANRKYKDSAIVVLPDAELNVIGFGASILQ